MASDKPLPDADDDIIDLTDLVEEGGAGNGAADDGVDMSFEQELDDLFGDAEPLLRRIGPARTDLPISVQRPITKYENKAAEAGSVVAELLWERT